MSCLWHGLSDVAKDASLDLNNFAGLGFSAFGEGSTILEAEFSHYCIKTLICSVFKGMQKIIVFVLL